MNNKLLTTLELETVVKLLAKLEPGFLPLPLFHAITRLTATPIVEIVPLRQGQDSTIEILLTKRAADDPVWPDKLHVPGTVIRASDTPGSLNDAFQRILSGELAGITTTQPVFVQNISHHSGRGMEVSQIYWTEVSSEPTTGRFYDTNNLPRELVASQLDFIPLAVEHYKQQKSLKPV